MGNKEEKKNKKTGKKVLISFIVVLLIITGAFAFYLSDYRKADDTAIQAMQTTTEVNVTNLTKDIIVFSPMKSTSIGLIYYPGAKVDGNAYAPMANELAKQGIKTILVDMPLNLAVLDEDAATDIMSQFPEIKSWYIGGHSMGGLVASNYAFENKDKLAGLIVVASKIKQDFTNTVLPVLQIVATNDNICPSEKIVGNTSANKLIVIDGGCHGYFGNYGEQPHDGAPTITREEQQEQTVNSIVKFINKYSQE